MSNPESSLDAGAPSAGIIIQTEKRRQWFEVGLVLIVAFGSSVLYSYISHIDHEEYRNVL